MTLPTFVTKLTTFVINPRKHRLTTFVIKPTTFVIKTNNKKAGKPLITKGFLAFLFYALNDYKR